MLGAADAGMPAAWLVREGVPDPSSHAQVLEDLARLLVEDGAFHAAIPILESERRIDLLVSDVGLPGMDGRQLAEVARRHRPDLRILFVTGYAEQATLHVAAMDSAATILAKPYRREVLAQTVHRALADPED